MIAQETRRKERTSPKWVKSLTERQTGRSDGSRGRSNLQIIESELAESGTSKSVITDIWAMYPAGWRRDAYRHFSESQRSGLEDVVLLESLDSAQAIERLIPVGEGQYEVIKCRVPPGTIMAADTAEAPGELLGYDVAYPGGDYYSAVRNGLHTNPHPELVSKYASQLNQCGLFATRKQTERFLADFRRYVPSETNSQFVVYELFAID